MKISLISSCLSDSIIKLQQMLKKHTNKTECEQLKAHLVHEVLIISYFLPQTELGLKEEDASEFILYLKPYIEGILLNFQGGDFTSYMRKTLRNSLVSFYRTRTRELRSFSVAEMESGIEMLSEAKNRYGSDIESVIQPDNNSKPVNILRAVFAASGSARRRFFIFLSSLCPFISEPDLALICKDLSINFREASGIRKYLIAISDADKTLEAMKATEERRNCHFAKALINEMKAESKRQEGNREEAEEYRAKAERRKELVKKSLIENRKLSLGLGPTILSAVYNESKGTIANDICLTKRLLSWCLSPSSYSSSLMLDLRINRKFASLAAQADSRTHLRTFSPYAEFNICKEYYSFRKNRNRLTKASKCEEI